MAKAIFYKKTLFTGKLNFNFEKERRRSVGPIYKK